MLSQSNKSIQETAKIIQKKMYTFRSLEVKQCEPEADQIPRRLCRGIVSAMFFGRTCGSQPVRSRGPRGLSVYSKEAATFQ